MNVVKHEAMNEKEKINVQLLFSPQEYAELERNAKLRKLPVPLYIKCAVLPGNGFYPYWQQLLHMVEGLPAGTRFNIKALFGVGWTMDRGIKLNLGKTFYNQVKAGTITDVAPDGKDSSEVMWYKRL